MSNISFEVNEPKNKIHNADTYTAIPTAESETVFLFALYF